MLTPKGLYFWPLRKQKKWLHGFQPRRNAPCAHQKQSLKSHGSSAHLGQSDTALGLAPLTPRTEERYSGVGEPPPLLCTHTPPKCTPGQRGCWPHGSQGRQLNPRVGDPLPSLSKASCVAGATASTPREVWSRGSWGARNSLKAPPDKDTFAQETRHAAFYNKIGRSGKARGGVSVAGRKAALRGSTEAQRRPSSRRRPASAGSFPLSS